MVSYFRPEIRERDPFFFDQPSQNFSIMKDVKVSSQLRILLFEDVQSMRVQGDDLLHTFFFEFTDVIFSQLRKEPGLSKDLHLVPVAGLLAAQYTY